MQVLFLSLETLFLQIELSVKKGFRHLIRQNLCNIKLYVKFCNKAFKITKEIMLLSRNKNCKIRGYQVMSELSIQQKELITQLKKSHPELAELSDAQILSVLNSDLDIFK